MTIDDCAGYTNALLLSLSSFSLSFETDDVDDDGKEAPSSAAAVLSSAMEADSLSQQKSLVICFTFFACRAFLHPELDHFYDLIVQGVRKSTAILNPHFFLA